jgi:hypothetical protein
MAVAVIFWWLVWADRKLIQHYRCRLLIGYPSQNFSSKWYISNRWVKYFILCKIWGSHRSDYEEHNLLECDIRKSGRSLSTFWNILPPSSWLNKSNEQASSKQRIILLTAGPLGLFFDYEYVVYQTTLLNVTEDGTLISYCLLVNAFHSKKNNWC